MIHVYAFVDGLIELPSIPGLAGAPLALEEGAGITAVVSLHDGDDGDRREAAFAHGLVVETLVHAACSVLPVRFGERFADREALHSALAARSGDLRAALDRVRDCAEIGVTVAAGPPATVQPTGTEYLRGRLAAETALEEIAVHLRAYIRAATEARGGSVAYLVSRTDAGEALGAAHAYAAGRADVVLACSGPWAPYSFGGGVA